MNTISIGLSVPLWVAILIILAGFAVAVYTYRTTLPPVSSPRRWTLIALRTLGIGLLLLALLEPILSSIFLNAEDPEIVVALDNSESMSLDGLNDSRIDEAREVTESLLGAFPEHNHPIIFSDTTKEFPGYEFSRLDSQITATGPATNLVFPFIGVAEQLDEKNVQAIVLITDGRYNDGNKPLLDAEKLGIPVFAVGLGDTVDPKDLSVQQLFTNEIAYVGTEFPVQVRVKSSGYDGNRTSIVLRDDNGVVSREPITLLQGVNEYTANFSYTPKEEGIVRLDASIESVGEELTLKNNRRSVFVKVRSNKRRYLIIAGSPNADLAFLRRHLARNPDIEVKTYVQKSGSEFLEGSLTAESFKEAETVVLIDYPTKESSIETIDRITSIVSRRNLPLLTILGSQVDYEKLRRIEPMLPVNIGRNRPNETQVFASITPNGGNSPIVALPDSSAWEELPPIYRSETTFTPKAESDVLATVRVGSTRLDDPLIVTRKVNRARSLIVLGYGLYRWQLLGEGRTEVAGGKATEVLRSFVENSMRWLAVRDEEKQVRITTNKELYNLGEPVRLCAQVYDESYQPLDDAEVKVIVESSVKSYSLTLAPAGNGRYEGTLSNPPAGDYRYRGTASLGNDVLGSDGGRFIVDEIGLEFIQPSMDVQLLRAIAERTDGKFYTMDQTETLIDDIRNLETFRPRTLESEEEINLRDSIWFLLAALLAFALEWILRKRSGML